MLYRSDCITAYAGRNRQHGLVNKMRESMARVGMPCAIVATCLVNRNVRRNVQRQGSMTEQQNQ
jgi:hypothetical protein